MSLEEAVEKYSKKWGVSREEAEKKIRQLLEESKSDRKEAVPNVENLFPEPLGELSKKVQDVNQALLSTAYTRRLLDTPPEDIAVLRERVEKLDRIVGDLKSGLVSQIKQLTETLEDKKREETREELLKELDNKINPLRETLQNLSVKLENIEKSGGKSGGSVDVRPEQILEEAEKVTEKAKNYLKRQGYKVEPDRLSEEQVKKMIEEAQREALATLPHEELKKRLEKAGYKIVGGPLTYEEVEKLIEEAKQKAQEEIVDDKRIDAVTNIVRDAVTKIIEMFKPAVEAYFTSFPHEEGASESAQSKE